MGISRDEVLAKLAQSVARGNILNWPQIFLSFDNLKILDDEIQRLGRIHISYLKAFSSVCYSHNLMKENKRAYRINQINAPGLLESA